MLQKRSNRRRTEERAVIVKKFCSSGLSQVAFCKAEGIAVSTLQNWLRKGEGTRAVFSEVSPPRPPAATVEILFPDGTALRVRSE